MITPGLNTFTLREHEKVFGVITEDNRVPILKNTGVSSVDIQLKIEDTRTCDWYALVLVEQLISSTTIERSIQIEVVKEHQDINYIRQDEMRYLGTLHDKYDESFHAFIKIENL
jgi:hypothetical protein